MFELDFFSLINGAGVEWMTFCVVLSSIFVILSGAIWPLMERWMERVEKEELVKACGEIDAGELEMLSTRLLLVEKMEQAWLVRLPALDPADLRVAWKKIQAFTRRREELDYQIDAIWCVPLVM